MAKREKVSLVLPYDFEAVFEYLTLEQCGRLIRAVFAFERRDEEPDFSDDTLLDITWKTNVRVKVEHNKQKYQEVLEARRASGKKGGRPKSENQMVNKKPNGFLENQNKPKKPNAADCDCDYDYDCECECECDKDIYPSNIQTTSCNNIDGYPQQPVENSDQKNVGNAEPDTGKQHPPSLDGMDLYLLDNKSAFELFRKEYPRRQGALRDVQTAWVTVTVSNHVLPGDLIMAARNYAARCKREKVEAKYIKMPQNFIRDGWQEYIPKYLPTCPHCHGHGVYEGDNGMIMCDCDRRYG